MFKWGLILLFILSVLVVNAQDSRRFTIWNKNAITVEPWKKVSIEVAEKIHYSPKINTVALKYGELNVAHEPKNWLEYGAGLRLSYLNLMDGNWLNENRLMATVDLTKELKEFEISFDNRFEYRTFQKLENYLRYKQALKLNFPGLTSWGMRFYVSEESYFKMNGDGMHLARFYSGLMAFDKKHFDMKIYYSLEKALVSDTWYTADILGLNLSFSI